MQQKICRTLIVLLLTATTFAAPLNAQQRRDAPPKKPPAPAVVEVEPTFDSLLAADSFNVYAEIRGVGGLIRSSAVTDLVEPIIKLGGPPKEFQTMVKWLSSHSDGLAGSRMMIAAWPSRPNLPNVLVAIEFASAEDAKKFYPELGNFLPKLLPPPTPMPTPTPAVTGEHLPVIATVDPDRRVEAQPTPQLPPYHLKQVGSLILISEAPIVLPNLRPKRSKLMAEDQNFVLARNRFASESVFLYFDLKTIEKEEKERNRRWQEEAAKREADAAANPPAIQEMETERLPEEQSPPPPEEIPETTVPPPPASTGTGTLSAGPPEPDLFTPLYSAFFGGESRWPEAIAAALVFEGDAYVVRTLLLNSPENKNNALPFLPQFYSGPEFAPQSPNVFPADVELFVSVSLDYQQIYDGTVKAYTVDPRARLFNPAAAKQASPFAAYEEKLGLKIKDDVLPLFGNELALILPKKSTKAIAEEVAKDRDGDTSSANVPPSGPAQASTNPVIAISVKDKEAVARLIPKVIESFGMKGANLLAQTEKRENTEVVSYAGVFAYAFIGDFLVLSPDPKDITRVVDAYLEHHTLASDSSYRNFTRWQPRQVLGQLYIAPTMVDQYFNGAVLSNDRSREFLSRVAPVIDPLTYSLSNDGSGPLHELHVPKNLIQTFIAQMSADAEQAPLRSNEAMTKTMLYSLAGGEENFKSGKGAGSYATLEHLISEKLIDKYMLDNSGYRVDLVTMGEKFEASAVPLQYGKTGKLSFFIDETGILRGSDHGGAPATAADDPIR